ncbi:MAG: sulfurtransferase [Pseudomonadota bacterium]|nr:sulfurtransferase [Pseudomonadota bacterium]
MDALVSTEWLCAHLGEDDLVVVDCSWHMPASGRTGRDEYLAAHIPGARFLDIDEVADHSDAAPHMLPGAEDFARAMEALGVGSDDRIVVYDNSPFHTASRGWFMLRHFGARQVAVLDGGFAKWTTEGRPTDSGEPPRRAARFEAPPREDVVSKEQMFAGVGLPVLDARSKARFEGSEADPRPGVAPGHIPGSLNLPFAALYNADGTFRSRDALRQLFESAGASLEAPFVATCGSGVTANSLIFAAHLAGNDSARLYDGSWSEWGADPAAPKARGPA